MSRGEELRAKFRAKGEAIRNELESPFGEFRFALNRFVAEVCDASTGHEFAKCMFESWETSTGLSLDAWFIENVKPLFRSVGPAPRWRLDPCWLFDEHGPMTFVTQYDHEETTYYVFEGQRTVPDGWIRVIKMGAQDDEGTIRLSGEITT